MNFAVRSLLVRCLACCALLRSAVALAAPPTVPDTREWSRLTPAQLAEIKLRHKNASPDERQIFRQRLREPLKTLTPQERQALIEQTRQRWQVLASEEKRHLANGCRVQVREMKPAKHRELLRQRRDLLSKLSPAERHPRRRVLSGDREQLASLADALQHEQADALEPLPAQNSTQLQTAMARQPARQRMALAMWARADADVVAIAGSMELDSNTAHQLLHRAKTALRRQLQELTP